MPPLKDRRVADNIKFETIHVVDGLCLPQAVPVLQICGTKIFVAAYPDRLCFDLHRPRVPGEGPIAVPATLETAASRGPTFIFIVAARSKRQSRSGGRTNCFSRRTGGGNCRGAFQNRSPFHGRLTIRGTFGR
ncbi:hypothetical protein NXC12_CH01308 [Rhizobium etli]|uniref:Uncharacterized protein n=1 Tax=Rhizobium etli TaxID=29449 RepID=A0AAN1BDQ7_RHIET|nr:hypothetical protein NXC12_CH01308 [Rhizobium etli]